MRLLKVKAKNFRKCKDEIVIDFVPMYKKSEVDKTYELNEIDEKLYSFVSTAIIGKNASGKTSVIDLINISYKLIENFRLTDEIISISKTNLELFFYYNKTIYYYSTNLISNSNISNDLHFDNEVLKYKKYTKTNIDKIFEVDSMKDVDIKAEYPDTISKLAFVFKNIHNYMDYYDDSDEDKYTYHESYQMYKDNVIDIELWNSLIRLFDGSINDLKEEESGLFLINNEKRITAEELFYMLSKGTSKGIALYTLVIKSLLQGTVLLVDEIENHFHKTLVENIISLYRDKKVNKKGASIVFTTHYIELLDSFNRNDNIWITKCDDSKINLTNMYRDYGVRNDYIKSKGFYANAYDTNVDYDRLMDIKRRLINEK